MSTSQTPRLGHFHWKVLILCPVTPISRLEVSRTNFHDARLQAALQPSSCFSCIKLNLCHAFCSWCLLCSVLGPFCSSTPKQDSANHPDILTKAALPEQYYEYETSLMISLANLSASLIRSRHHYIIQSCSTVEILISKSVLACPLKSVIVMSHFGSQGVSSTPAVCSTFTQFSRYLWQESLIFFGLNIDAPSSFWTSPPALGLKIQVWGSSYDGAGFAKGWDEGYKFNLGVAADQWQQSNLDLRLWIPEQMLHVTHTDDAHNKSKKSNSWFGDLVAKHRIKVFCYVKLKAQRGLWPLRWQQKTQEGTLRVYIYMYIDIYLWPAGCCQLILINHLIIGTHIKVNYSNK